MSSPLAPEMSDKSKKYDRQIRLWGEHGQSLLESSHVCLINASALSSEILKGLVLPGIGGFTIVDGGVVTEEDIGCNFFLDAASIGLSKAKCCTQLLQELNPDVNGDYIDESVEILLQNSPDFFSTFNVVIASALSEKTIVTISNKLWDVNVPFFYCRSVGFMGSVRLQLKEHCVIESHPDNKQSDLRLENPFPTLKQHLDNAVLTSKVPWPLVLYKFLKIWINKNDGKSPQTYREKNELRDMIRAAMTADEENYEEAIKAVNSSFGGSKAPSSLQTIFNDSCCTNLNKSGNTFWILAKCLKEFVENEPNGCLPLPGVLPDMTADTESYINLQNVYRQQAMHDADIIYRRSQHILKELGLPFETITEKDAKLFCREASTIALIRGTKLKDEYENTFKIKMLAQNLETPDSLMVQYVALRAYERFQTEHGYIPGECNVETDTARLKGLVSKILAEWGIQTTISDETIHELCRYGGAEIHSVSAFLGNFVLKSFEKMLLKENYTGGCTAQEIIKIITKQYKPLDNTFLYNAITTETATFKL